MPHEKSLKAISRSIPVEPVGYMNGGPISMKAKNAATPLCYVEGTNGKALGHDWLATPSPSVRVCSRCRLVQYKSKIGHWKNAASLKNAQAMVKRAVQVGDLWSTLENEE